MSQKKQILGVAIFVVALMIIGLIMSIVFKEKAPAPTDRQAIEKNQQIATAKLLATDPSDPSHINNLKYIKDSLDKYYTAKKMYPKDLNELVPLYGSIVPRYSTSKPYFYAYYPSENPTAYHIGAVLGGRNQASPKAFSEDADLNSEKAGYVGGFNGADPVYDLKGGK